LIKCPPELWCWSRISIIIIVVVVVVVVVIVIIIIIIMTMNAVDEGYCWVPGGLTPGAVVLQPQVAQLPQGEGCGQQEHVHRPPLEHRLVRVHQVLRLALALTANEPHRHLRTTPTTHQSASPSGPRQGGGQGGSGEGVSRWRRCRRSCAVPSARSAGSCRRRRDGCPPGW